MRVMIVVCACVMIDDDPSQSRQVVPCGNPLDDLIERLKGEMRHGRDSVKWRRPDGAKVA